MVYTGYFSRVKKYTEADLIPISIARYSPKWWNYDTCSLLAPTSGLLMRYKAGKVNPEEYEREYREYLDNINVKAILENLIPGKRNIILCCYEKPGDFCHRHIFADYVFEHFGIKMEEYIIK